MVYPFDQRFIFAVENIEWHESVWLSLILRDGEESKPLLDVLARNGYSSAQVQKNISTLKLLDLERLVSLAMLPDYRSEPALAVLKTRATEEVFAKARQLSESSLNIKRALAVKILNSECNKVFLDRTKPLLKALQETETDELVMEQLGYAFSKLQIA